MKAKYLAIAFISSFTLASLAGAQGEKKENGSTEEPKPVAKASPGEKMTEQQWKVPPLFFDRDEDSTEEKPDPVRVLQEHGVRFPSGATASYSPKNGKLTVRNTPENLEMIDATIKHYMSHYRSVGRTAEDFKKWAKQEYKRRQAAVELMKKVHDTKSAKKARDKLMKIYKAKKTAEADGFLGNLTLSYRGTLSVIDQKTRDTEEKKFAKQLEEIYEQQQRLHELDGSEEIEDLILYTGCVYGFAEDDKTGERWEITKLGIKVILAGESGD